MSREEEQRLTIEIDEEKIRETLEEILKLIEKAETVKIKGDVETKTISLGRAGKRSEWKYILNLYQPNMDITVTLKRFERQPVAYAILKLTDKVTEVEDLQSFLEKMAKLYILIKEIKKKLGIEKKEREEKDLI
jgi:hypothetical protein